MLLKNLWVTNFRNYAQLEVEPREFVNIFFGFNAQGKTNILEAIYCLATSRSHRSSKDIELIKWGRPYFQVKGSIVHNNTKTNMEVNCAVNGQKTLKIEGIKQTKLPDYIGNLTVVLFSPEDLAIVKGGPRERRRFLDIEVSQISKTYAFLLIQYYKILGQRNSLLKSFRNTAYTSNQLEVWDLQLIDLGSKILKKRFEMVKKLALLAKSKHQLITAGKEILEIKYFSSLDVRPDFSVGEIAGHFQAKLKELRKEELKRSLTLVGPHRDDLVFYINGIDARLYGSQGQQRTVALALKLAELELIHSETGEYPVLLLDDVLSELDNLRRHYLLSAVKQKIQTFVTTTNLEFIDERILKEAQVYRVDEGMLLPNL